MLFLTRLLSNSRHIPFEHYRSMATKSAGMPKRSNSEEAPKLSDDNFPSDSPHSFYADQAESDGLVSTPLDRVSHGALANDPYLLED